MYPETYSCLICGGEYKGHDVRPWTCDREECHKCYMELPDRVREILAMLVLKLNIDPQQAVALLT